MTVRDVYIFEGLGRGSSDYDRNDYDRNDYDRDDAEEEVLEDARYARRIRRSPPISDRSIRRAARGRRAGAIAEREIAREIEDREIEDEVDDVPVEAALNRAAFGGMGNIGAVMAVIGLLILVAAASGPSWGWGGAGRGGEGPDAYGFGPAPHGGYTDDLSYRYRDGGEGRYAGAYDGGSRSFMDPSRAMFVGGTLFIVGVVLLATRRRSFLLR